MSGSGSVDRFARLRDVFAAAAPLTGSARDDYVARACGDDVALRDEVERILRDSEDSHELFDAVDRDAARDAIPERIGEFTVHGVLGHGGMGVVYRAEQARPRRLVALKVLQPGLVRGDSLRRFLQEAEILGALQHPGIASVIEAGTFESGFGELPYFAMELVDGIPLDRYASDHGLDTTQRVELVVQVCEAIQHAHERGVVHRDLKPGNVLVAEVAGRPLTKVLDFGIARCSALEDRAQLRTVTGQVFGTLPYMSPEQIDGQTSLVDARTDVYALGAILYELLTGEQPITVTDLPLTEAARRIRETMPPSLRPRLGVDLDTVLACALAKEPDARYSSAGAFAGDLLRWIRKEPIVARRASRLHLARQFVRRNRTLVAGVVATFVALLAGLVGVGYLAERNREIAEHETEVRLRLRTTLYASQMSAAGRYVKEPLSSRRLDQLLAQWPDPIGAEAELRGFEYRFLRALTAVEPPRHVGAPIFGLVSFTPSRMALLTPKRVGWVDPSAPETSLEAIDVRDDEVGPIAFDVRRNELICRKYPDHVLWRRLGNSERDHAVALREPIQQVIPSQSGPWLAVVHDESVAVLDRDRGTIAARFGGDGRRYGNSLSVTFSADGARCALARADESTIEIRTTRDWEIERTIRASMQGAYHLAFAPQGSMLAIGHRDGLVEFRDVDTDAARVVGMEADGIVLASAWTPDGRRFVTSHEYGGAFVHELGEGARRPLRGFGSRLCTLSIAPDGRTLYSGTLEGDLFEFDLDAPTPTWEQRRGTAQFNPEVRWSSDSATLVVGRRAEGVRRWDATTGRPVAGDTESPSWYSHDLAFVVRRIDDRLVAFATGSDDALWELDDPDLDFEAMDWSPTAPVLAIASQGRLWRFDAARQHAMDPIELSAGRRLRWTRDGEHLLRAKHGVGHDSVEVLDAATGIVVASVKQPETVNGLCSDPTGNLLAVALASGDVRILDWRQDRELLRLADSRGDPTLSWHPDGTRLVTSNDAGLHIWDVERGAMVLTLPGWAGTAAWSPDGHALAIVLRTRELFVWRDDTR